MLAALGHAVLQVPDGLAAITTLEAKGSVDLVLTDLVMPGLTGWDLVKTVKPFRIWSRGRSDSKSIGETHVETVRLDVLNSCIETERNCRGFVGWLCRPKRRHPAPALISCNTSLRWGRTQPGF